MAVYLAKEITACRIEWLQVIHTLSTTKRYPPTMREVAAAKGSTMSSTQSMFVVLKKHKLIDWEAGKSRTIVLTAMGMGYVKKD